MPATLQSVSQADATLDKIITDAVVESFGHAPPMLWHYTNAQGCEAILNTKTLRLSNLRFMNDAQEFLYAIDIIKVAIEQYEKHHTERAARIITGALKDFLSSADDGLIPSIYAVCFSELEDDLNQWRSYTGTGQGYSLGFAGLKLWDSFDVKGTLLKCIYDQRQQVEILSGAIGKLIMLFISIQNDDSVNNDDESVAQANQLVRDFFAKAADLIVGMKHPKFQAEAEWRYVIYNPPAVSISFLAKNHFISPIVTLRCATGCMFPVEKAWAGPGPIRNVNLNVLRSMLEKYGFSSVATAASDIPYRIMG